MPETTAETVEPETTDTPDEAETETPGLEPDEDEEPEDGASPAPPPETPPAPASHSEAWWEKAWGSSEKENERHAGRIQQIFEEEAQEFEQCPMCLGGPAGWLTIPEFSEEHAALVRARLGMDDPANYEPMRGAVVCGTCKGKGKVKTPSQVPGYQSLMCPDCRQSDTTGRTFATGWLYVAGPNDPARPEYAPVPVTVTELATAPPAPAVADNGTGEVVEMPYDAWSRPVGHPHFGIPPADVGA